MVRWVGLALLAMVLVLGGCAGDRTRSPAPDPGAGRLALSREGVYVVLAVSQWEQDTFVSLQRRDGLMLTEAQAMEVAKAIIGNHESGVAWEVRFEEAHLDEAKGVGGYARPAWVIGRVYPYGNKEVVYVDALTGEPYQVWTIEGDGFGG